MFATPNIRNSNPKRSHSPRERISLPDRLSHSSRLSWAWCWILCYQWRCRTRLRRHARRRGGGRCHEWAETCSLSLSGHCHARGHTDRMICVWPFCSPDFFEDFRNQCFRNLENIHATNAFHFTAWRQKLTVFFPHPKHCKQFLNSHSVHVRSVSDTWAYWYWYYLDTSPLPHTHTHPTSLKRNIHSTGFVMHEANGSAMTKNSEDSWEKMKKISIHI